MFSKRSIIALLVGLNVLLLVLLVMGSYSMPAAFAGARAPDGDYICVTAKAQGQSYDVLYMLDTKADTLHALYPTSVQSKQYATAAPRDLAADFGQ
ncbi:MAG: hypothetical protein JSU63_07820 [Phycisphaerales bacterium]|nr:MAG: hypothetical protein JSU63_07820 [Phycisphaerales bacterium]